MTNSDVKTFLLTYASGSVSACTAEAATFPADLTKTRMQIQGEVYSGLTRQKRGMLKTIFGIVKEEGITKLWYGLTPAIWRQLIYSGARISIYTKFRDAAAAGTDIKEFPYWKSALCGGAAGAVSQFIVNPLDLVKVQLQMDGVRVLHGKAPRLKPGVFRNIIDIYRHAGIKALYKGWFPNVQRSAVVNLSDIGTYDSTKRLLISHFGFKNGFAVQCISGLTAGFFAALFGAPIDTLKSRVMNQPVNKKGQGLYYRGTIDCLYKSIRNEGVMALYKGFIPLWMRLGPYTVIFWITLENTRALIGLDSF